MALTSFVIIGKIEGVKVEALVTCPSFRVVGVVGLDRDRGASARLRSFLFYLIILRLAFRYNLLTLYDD